MISLPDPKPFRVMRAHSAEQVLLKHACHRGEKSERGLFFHSGKGWPLKFRTIPFQASARAAVPQ